MPFPTVKSDPWRKGLRQRRRHILWSEEFWKRLCKQASPLLSVVKADKWNHIPRFPSGSEKVSPQCAEMIVEMNLLLYGHR